MKLCQTCQLSPPSLQLLGFSTYLMSQPEIRTRLERTIIKTVTFIGTENGVRIKSWGRPSNGFAKDILFQHATMINVQNPILIDQNYCPDQKNCPGQVALELTAEDKQQL
ncbi:polygalacturonase-like [Senna tora]|uniref:Polygalacturonase-like n=1 Tax=Senna tora TaxID=362788 RepID=A0A834TL25_9FABA|nr:polygalacturonase-like [Senna tora]